MDYDYKYDDYEFNCNIIMMVACLLNRNVFYKYYAIRKQVTCKTLINRT